MQGKDSKHWGAFVLNEKSTVFGFIWITPNGNWVTYLTSKNGRAEERYRILGVWLASSGAAEQLTRIRFSVIVMSYNVYVASPRNQSKWAPCNGNKNLLMLCTGRSKRMWDKTTARISENKEIHSVLVKREVTSCSVELISFFILWR